MKLIYCKPHTDFRGRVLVAFLAGTTLAPGPSAAATLEWNNAATGDWFDPSSWTPAVTPGAGDIAQVNNGGTAKAIGVEAPTVSTLQIGAGTGNVSGAVTTATADLALGGGSALTVGFASDAGSAAEGTLSVGGSIVGIAPSTLIGTYSIGTAQGDGAKASGTVVVAGDVVGNQGFVGTTGSGSDISAEGNLTVGGDLTGLRGVGIASPASLNSTANGTVTVTGGDLTLGTGFVAIGQAFGAGSTANGSVSVETGDLRIAPSPLSIGVAQNSAATGLLEAAGVDSTAAALGLLAVGSTTSAGTASGTLTLGRGDLRLDGNAVIGTASIDAGGVAQGTATLGGALQAEGVNRLLRVGTANGTTTQSGPGSATGALSAAGISGFRNASVGLASGFAGLGLDAEATLSVGAGGIVNGTDPGGVLTIGRAQAQSLNLAVSGPGPLANAAATVSGDISGYDFVQVGTVENAGTATGSLTLGPGAMTTTGLLIGLVNPPSSGLAATDAVGTASGRVEVNGGSVVVDNPAPVFGGLTRIGEVFQSGLVGGHTAKGTLALTDASFDSGGIILGTGKGSDGTLLASNSDIRAGFMQLGGQGGGTGRIELTGSTLTAAADPERSFSGALLLRGNDTALTATNSDVVLDGTLAIMRTGGNSASGDTARMSLAGGSLAVGGSIFVGEFRTGSRGELSLAAAPAIVAGDVRVGQSANFGTLFGDALLHLDGSLMDIAGGMFLDLGGELSFGIGGLVRGLGGYGAFDALSTSLLGGNALVDFAGLAGSLGFDAADFDLISVESGFTGDFGLVSLVNVPTGYSASHGFTLEGDVWRVTLTRDLAPVPLPAGGWLLLSVLTGTFLFRRRRGA